MPSPEQLSPLPAPDPSLPTREEIQQLSEQMRQLEGLIRRDIASRPASPVVPHDAELNTTSGQDLDSMAKFLQAWHRFSPSQKARLWATMRNTAPPLEASEGNNYVSVPEASLLLDVSQERVRVFLKERRLSFVHDPRGRVRIPQTALESFHRLEPGRPSIKRTEH